MAVPKKKTSKSRRDMRRANHAKKYTSLNYAECKNCGHLKVSHHLCKSCKTQNKITL